MTPRRRPPGHWAKNAPGFRYGRADLAAGLDDLAARSPWPDGLTLIVKAFGATPGEVTGATTAQARDWFRRAYTRWGPASPALGDVVCLASQGISGFEAGWGGSPGTLRGGGPGGAARQPRRARAPHPAG